MTTPSPDLTHRLTLKGDKKTPTTRFIDTNTVSIAEQLTLMEHEMLQLIKPSEFLKQSWSKSDKESKAPNIMVYIIWFNKVSRWVSTEIVKGNNAQERSVIIGKFIEIGMKLKELRNFNGVMEIISSLHSSSISRLKQSWAVSVTSR